MGRVLSVHQGGARGRPLAGDDRVRADGRRRRRADAVCPARRALRGLRARLPAVGVLALMQVAGPFLLISAGEQHLASSLTGILVATAPIFTFLLAIGLDQDERVHGTGLFGVVL